MYVHTNTHTGLRATHFATPRTRARSASATTVHLDPKPFALNPKFKTLYPQP